MATKKDAKKDAKNAAERATEPGTWRVLVPFAGAALAALGPALALGGMTIRDRREQSSRMPGLAVIPVIGGLLAVVAAIAWRNRERVMEMAGEVAATAESLAARVSDEVTGDETGFEQPATPDFPYTAPVQGTPAV